jgi:hypothetical protein
MKFSDSQLAIPFLAALALLAAPAGNPSIPNEGLRYNINWPSGLSLGEAQLSAASSRPSPEDVPRLHLSFDVDASIPGFAVSDRYRSDASGTLCSVEFQRTATHGQKKTNEKTSFDSHAGTATRETDGGGKTELKASSCGRDALAFLYFVRQELGQGRLPPPQTVFFGAPYEIRLDFAGTQSIRIGETPQEADRVTAAIKGPASTINVEMFFLKDRARTPALVRVPLALGTFSMELVR